MGTFFKIIRTQVLFNDFGTRKPNQCFFQKKIKKLGLTQAPKLKTEKMFQIHLKLPVFLQDRLVNLYLRYFLGKGQQVKPAKTANFTFFSVLWPGSRLKFHFLIFFSLDLIF